MRKVFLAVTIVAMSSACSFSSDNNVAKEEPKVEFTDAEKLVAEIEKTHKKEVFEQNEVVQFDLQLNFGGKERFNGRVYVMISGAKIKMEDDSTLMFWNGEKAMVLPSTENNEKARFDLLTWSYFFTAPYKLSDPGTNHQFLGSSFLGGAEYDANKLTFDQGTGDTPEDWYIVYKDKNSGLLAAMAYIVTSGGATLEEAEKDPHVITYEAYTDIGGIPFATQWNFWTWNESGEMHKLLGNATIGNIEFTKKAGDLFSLTAS